MHFPAVLSAGNSLFVTDTFSLYQFDASEHTKQALKTPKYTSNNIIVGLTEQFIIQKHRIEQQSCITKAPLSEPSNESIIFCSKTYYKARYYNGAVYVVSNTPNNNKANHGITVSLERYTLDGNMSWRMTDMKDPSSSIVAAWNNTIITLSSDGILTAIDSNSGSTIYTKEYASELSLEKDFYQFNHFFVDKDNGLFIVASRYHNRLTVIDIPTGAIVKTHDFGLAFAHNKYLEEDFHYISLGEYAFPQNTIM
jgi:hypothetical protein